MMSGYDGEKIFYVFDILVFGMIEYLFRTREHHVFIARAGIRFERGDDLAHHLAVLPEIGEDLLLRILHFGKRFARKKLADHFRSAVDVFIAHALGYVDKAVSEDTLARHDDEQRRVFPAGDQRYAADRFGVRMRRDRDGGVIGQLADDGRHALDEMLHVVRLAGESVFDIVEIALGKIALLHELFYIKTVRLRRGHPAARRMELRKIPKLFQRGELVAHRGRTHVGKVLFRDALAGYGHGGIDVFVYDDLQDLFFAIRHLHTAHPLLPFGTLFFTMLALSSPKC